MQGCDKKNFIRIPIGMSWNTSVEFAGREGYNIMKWRGLFYAQNKFGVWKMVNYNETKDWFYD